MKEIKGDIWRESQKVNGWVVIPTNGFVKKNGECVMGRGLAYQTKISNPDLPRELGDYINEYGNIVFPFPKYNLYTFPVKHNWWEMADLKLIENSAHSLQCQIGLRTSPDFGKLVFMPHVGCGNGSLKWEDVRPIIENYLDDKVIICDNS
jgi:hypothetical protein